MKKFFILIFLFLFFFFIQTTFLSRFSFFGLKPNLIFVLLILWAAKFGPVEGVVWGLGFGFLTDTTGNSWAIHLISFPLAGFLAGLRRVEFTRGQLFWPLIWVFVFSFGAVVLEYFLVLFYSQSNFSPPLFFLVLASFLNVITVPLIYPIFFWEK